jgi:hypothetical protein
MRHRSCFTLFAQLGPEERINYLPSIHSGGQVQRVAVIRTRLSSGRRSEDGGAGRLLTPFVNDMSSSYEQWIEGFYPFSVFVGVVQPMQDLSHRIDSSELLTIRLEHCPRSIRRIGMKERGFLRLRIGV